MNPADIQPCFLFTNGEWMMGEWYHLAALYEFILRHASFPSNEVELISIHRPGTEPFRAYFSKDEGRILFMETSAQSTDEIVVITQHLPVI